MSSSVLPSHHCFLGPVVYRSHNSSVELKQKLNSLPKDKKINYLLILIGGCEFFALMSYGIGINFQSTALVNPIAAAFPIVTVILARIFLKGKIETNQTIGIGAVILALIIISL